MLEPLIQESGLSVWLRVSWAARPPVLYFWHSVGNRPLTLLSNCLTTLIFPIWEPVTKSSGGSDSVDPDEENRLRIRARDYGEVARRNLRIYEVGNQLLGTHLRGGKKIGWKDGVRALYCLLKYSSKNQHKGSCAGSPPPDRSAFRDEFSGEGCLQNSSEKF